MCTAGPEPGGRGYPSNLTWGSAATLSQEPNCEWEAGRGAADIEGEGEGEGGRGSVVRRRMRPLASLTGRRGVTTKNK